MRDTTKIMSWAGRFCFILAAMFIIAPLSMGVAVAQNTQLGTGALAHNTTGSDNTALGFNALFENTTADNNTATGANALGANIGPNNTATGANALFANSNGGDNTATGFDALFNNETGSFNTATGFYALLRNTTGENNTACGAGALVYNTTGDLNTASGAFALTSNTTGLDGTASGALALDNNTTGEYNTATGYKALYANSTGGYDTAAGVNALWKNTTGVKNTTVGTNAMFSNTIGSNNIALGYQAGFSLTTGSNNIDIGSLGVAAESNTIRIGTQGTQTATYIAGIFNSSASGGAVEVSNTGKLGMVLSSARYKRDIHDMDAASSNLMKLRPVTFRYKDDLAGTLQYGLVAEEVEKLYPELVIRDTAGKIQSIRYLTLTSMLLNEVQKQAVELRNQRRENVQQTDQIRRLSAQVAEVRTAFEERLSRLEQTIQAKNGDGKLAAAR